MRCSPFTSFKIIYTGGKNNNFADAVSRYPTSGSEDDLKNLSCITSATNSDEYAHNVAVNSLSSLDNLQATKLEKVESETLKDKNLEQFLDMTQEGFPSKMQDWPTELNNFRKFKHDLSSIGAVILYNKIGMHQLPECDSYMHLSFGGTCSLQSPFICETSTIWYI